MDLTPEEKTRLHAENIAAPSSTAIAIAAGLVAAILCYCSDAALTTSYGPAMFCSPFFMGAIVGLFAYRRPVRGAIVTTLVVLLIALSIAILSLREGVVCCLMALPFVLPVSIVGALCGAVLRRYARGRRARRLLGLTLVLACVSWQAIEGALDDPARHPLHTARSAIAIAAPPERVFAALTSRELEVHGHWPWFLRIGLPMPIRLVVEAPSQGGRVTGFFSTGVAHGHVTEWAPGRALAYSIDRYDVTDLPFHITRLGRAPTYGFRAERVADWLEIENTRWQLAPRSDGGTDLRREIVWRRHLAPAFYFGWLQQTIIQRGQDRLLALVREQVTRTPAATDLVAAQ